MPRVRSEKRSRSTRVSKKPYEEYDLPEFRMQTRRRITYFDRKIHDYVGASSFFEDFLPHSLGAMVGFFSMRSFPAGREISLDDLIQTSESIIFPIATGHHDPQSHMLLPKLLTSKIKRRGLRKSNGRLHRDRFTQASES